MFSLNFLKIDETFKMIKKKNWRLVGNGKGDQIFLG
jgi:hypothetical protein